MAQQDVLKQLNRISLIAVKYKDRIYRIPLWMAIVGVVAFVAVRRTRHAG